MTIVDLTRVLDPSIAVYPGDPRVRFRNHADLRGHGYRVTEVTLGTHAGTHLDAPAHFLEDGAAVDALPLETLVGPARVVDSERGETGRAAVAPGERIVVRSGWGARWGTAGYFEGFPGLAPELAAELASAPAALVGLETPSLHPDAREDARLHRLLLRAGVVVVENLAGVDRLPERIFLAALPLPLRGLDGAPCRVVALVEEEVSW